LIFYLDLCPRRGHPIGPITELGVTFDLGGYLLLKTKRKNVTVSEIYRAPGRTDGQSEFIMGFNAHYKDVSCI